MPTTLSFFRGLHHPDFNSDDVQRLRLVLPHLSRSLGVMQRLKSAELKVATSMAALDRLPSGVLLLDSFGLVAFANKAIDYAIGATLNRNTYDTTHFSNSIRVLRISKKSSYDLQFSSLGDHVEFREDSGRIFDHYLHPRQHD